jgi:hypothetical protein
MQRYTLSTFVSVHALATILTGPHAFYGCGLLVVCDSADRDADVFWYTDGVQRMLDM